MRIFGMDRTNLGQSQNRRTWRTTKHCNWLFYTLSVLTCWEAVTCAMSDTETAATLISCSGLPGGMCAVIEDRDLSLTLALGTDERFVIQSLITCEEQVTQARQAIQASGCYGRVSAGRFDGRQLPYTDNLINLVVVVDGASLGPGKLSLDEILRTLTPLGSAYIRISNSEYGDVGDWNRQMAESLREFKNIQVESRVIDSPWLKVTKQWPPEIDEWTHFLHAADGNPVARDSVVGPPQHYQWLGGPGGPSRMSRIQTCAVW